MTLLMTLLALFLHPSRTDWLSRLYCRVQSGLTGTRVKVFSHPDLQPDQPYLFVQNHTNHFDFILAYTATPHFKQGIELASHFRYPIYGWFMKTRGTIPVYPGRRNHLEYLHQRMAAELEQGHSLIAFPEATRTLNGRVGRFRKGIFRVARDLALPIVPIAVTGTWHLMRKGSLLIKPGKKVAIHLGKPLITSGLNDEDLNLVIQAAQKFIADHVDHQDDQDQ